MAGSRARSLIRLPKNLRPKPLADGTIAYFFELPPYARPRMVGKGRDKRRIPAERHGRPCPVESRPLGTDLAFAIGEADKSQCHARGMADRRRAGAQPRHVAWLFAWYRTKDRFKDLGAEVRKDYRRIDGHARGGAAEDDDLRRARCGEGEVGACRRPLQASPAGDRQAPGGLLHAGGAAVLVRMAAR
jgi:hypothetical protein